MKAFVMIALAASLVSAAASPALADDALPTRMVGYRDLDLNTAAGRNLLEKRVQHAVASVCDTLDEAYAVRLKALGECRTAAYSSARPQLDLAFERARRGIVEVAARSASGGIRVSAGR